MRAVPRSLACVLLVAFGIAVAAPTATSAAGPVQKCTGPSATAQSGRTTISPGINGRATVQAEVWTIHLFQCVPSTPTGGSGTLTIKLNTSPITCAAALVTSHVWHTSATIKWKSNATSTIPLTVTTTGPTRLANLNGTISAGLFAGHTLTGQLSVKPVVSPNGHTQAEACANKVAPGHGTGAVPRIAIVGFTHNTTQPVKIT
jgi:hypothetical protein